MVSTVNATLHWYGKTTKFTTWPLNICSTGKLTDYSFRPTWPSSLMNKSITLVFSCHWLNFLNLWVCAVCVKIIRKRSFFFKCFSPPLTLLKFWSGNWWPFATNWAVHYIMLTHRSDHKELLLHQTRRYSCFFLCYKWIYILFICQKAIHSLRKMHVVCLAPTSCSTSYQQISNNRN